MPFENLLVNSRIGVGILYSVRSFMALFFKSNTRFDVIVTSSHFPSDVLSAILLHIRNSKSRIVVYHHGISISPTNGLIMRTISTAYNYLGTLLATRFGDIIFVINKPTKDFLLCIGAKGQKIVLTRNGVEIPDDSSLTKEKSSDACFLGWLDKRKGVYDLLKVWKNVCEKRNNAKLAIIGSGPEKEQVSKIIVEMKLENNVILTGFLTGDKKYGSIQSSRVFIFPSHIESWGIAIAEAMACGLPVVAFDLPVYKEVFEGKIVTVPLGDTNEMARQVIFLLNPEIAQTMGEANKNFIKRYDWNLVSQKELSKILDLPMK